MTGREVEIVEAKKQLDFTVVGQCLAGIDMFTRAYPRHDRLLPVAVVRGDLDQGLLWVCHYLGIQVRVVAEDEL